MPDNLSPEERLLRLIKGEKTDSPPPPVPPKPTDKPVGKPVDKSADKPTPPVPEPPKKSTDPKPAQSEIKPKPAPPPDKPVSKPDPVKLQPSTAVPSEPVKKPVPPPTPPKEQPKPAASAPKKSAPAPTTSAPKEPSVAPAAIPEDTPVFTPPRSVWIVYAVRWLVSGFNFFNILLLFILIIVILLTFWFLPAQQTPAQTAAAIVPGLDNDGTTEEFIAPLPRPFPYYVTAFAQKSLFKVIKPPPPPKPKVERKEREKPKILIETLTRHLVLQGIVYDIGPPQAIVFDKKANKTMFLGNGDMITDQVQIKEIHRGKVVLQFEEQTQELTF